MPRQVHIIGCGIIGLVCGLTLLQAGFDVTLYDKADSMGQGASRLGGVMIAPFTEAIAGATEAGLMGQTSCQWWADVCGDAFHQTGSVIVSGMGGASLAHTTQKAKALGWGDKVQHLNDSQLREILPHVSDTTREGLFITDEGHINPEMALSILYQKIKEGGGQFIFNTDAKPNSSGIWVNCTGMGAVSDLSPDLRGVKGERLIIKAPWLELNYAVRWLHPRFPFYSVPRGGGLFSVGATMIETDEASPLPTVGGTLHLLAGLGQLFPSLLEAEIVAVDADLRPSFPDNMPKITEKDGVLHINGAYRHGFLLAPVMSSKLKAIL